MFAKKPGHREAAQMKQIADYSKEHQAIHDWHDPESIDPLEKVPEAASEKYTARHSCIVQ